MSDSLTDSGPLLAALRQRLRGEVLGDTVSLGIYATDASNYQIVPVAVVLPLDAADVRAAVEVAVRFGVPILPRGGGTSLAGQTVAAALVIDFSKHMNRILEIDAARRRVRVEPGIVRDELNAALAPHGLHFAPDPSTGSRANVGGMIGNNSSGARSLLYGKTIDHVEGLRVLLADGTEMELAPMDPSQLDEALEAGDRRAQVLRGLRRIVDEHRDAIIQRYPTVMRRVGGYPLDELTNDDDWNPARILVGSEGTLGVTLEATLRLEPVPEHKAVCVVHFSELLDAIRAVERILPHGPSAVEIVDRTILELARDNRESSAQIAAFLEGDPAAILVVEFYGATPTEVRERCDALARDLLERGLAYACPVFTSAAAQAQVWKMRKNGLGLMLGMKGDRKPLPFIEDAAIPVTVLPDYIERVLAICEELDTDVALYAHASVGVIHLRPVLDLRRADDIERMKQIAERTFDLVVEYGGAWSGEHGDGLVRSPFNERYFGPEIYGALRQVKELFDPRHLMNPGKIVDAPPMDRDLRYGTAYRVAPFDTVYRYRQDGSFAAAVEMCSGVGQCRKTLTGTMCPSYIATRDEEHSTRGRANALRLAMSGQLRDQPLTGDRVRQALDLCLSCKACKTECPSNVDMAKLKAEVSQLLLDERGASRRDRLIRDSAAMARRLAGPWAPLINRLQRTGPARRLLELGAGIDRRRTLPAYATRRFGAWMKSRSAGGVSANGGGGGYGDVTAPAASDRPRVALFADTYLDCHEPGIGRAAVELLESCGYEVVLAEAGCCQRPRISHGFLRQAREDGEATLRNLDEHVRQGTPIVVCEPSCASALTDDLPDLIRDQELADRVAGAVTMIDVFLDRALDAEGSAVSLSLRPELGEDVGRLLVHGHCHQKALYGTDAMKRLLARAGGVEVDEVDSGCCGMAGAFGYEREHYEISRKIGEERLFPALRALDASTAVVACGFSCRHQIEHFTGRAARHWVETLRGPQGTRG